MFSLGFRDRMKSFVTVLQSKMEMRCVSILSVCRSEGTNVVTVTTMDENLGRIVPGYKSANDVTKTALGFQYKRCSSLLDSLLFKKPEGRRFE